MNQLLKLYLPVLLIIISITGCISTSTIATTSNVKKENLDKIPRGSKVIILSKATSADSLYEEIYAILISRGHRIFKDDKLRHYLTTEGKDVGVSTSQRMAVIITQNGENSTCKITTEWKAGAEATNFGSILVGTTMQSDWEIATWDTSRLGIAFAESYSVAREIKDCTIEFIK